LFYHIPLRNSSNIKNCVQILNLLKGFSEVHLMAGHTHYNENYIYNSPIVAYEHIHGAACGAWWHSTLNLDGTPNGYAVYEIKGSSISNWFYKPTKLSKDFQIRLHKGDDVFGGEYGLYSFGLGSNTIVANIWNFDPQWSIEVFENGVKVENLNKFSSRDAWTVGYHCGVLNRSLDNYDKQCKHLFLHTMINSNATIEIRATDRFGNVYTQNEIVSDYVTATSYDYLK